MSRKENILNAVTRAGIVRIRTIANNALWLCALVVPVSFVAALVALGIEERVFAWVFVGVAILTVLFAASFIGYFARFDPDRLQSEEYQLRQKELLLRPGRTPEMYDTGNQPVKYRNSRTRIENGEKK